jgi:hypothetical protein
MMRKAKLWDIVQTAERSGDVFPLIPTALHQAVALADWMLYKNDKNG